MDVRTFETGTNDRLKFWNSGRRRRLAGSILLSLVISLGLILLIDPAHTSSLKRGDFPAFYAAGQILLRGADERLYDYRLHSEIQNQYWSSLDGEFYAFSYPPYVALLYQPLAHLPPAGAKAAVVITGFLLVGALLFQAVKMNPQLARARLELAVLLLAWAPLLSALAAGQNTIYTMILLLLLADFAPRDGRKNELIAGTILALMFFKPHYAILPGLILLCARRYRIAAVCAAELFVLYLLTAIRFGFGWPGFWLNALSRFAADDKAVNRHLMVSLNGFFDASGVYLGVSPETETILVIAASAVSLVIAGVFLRRAFLIGLQYDGEIAGGVSTDCRRQLSELLLFSAPAIALISTHTLYYDASLALIPLVTLFSSAESRRIVPFKDFTVNLIVGIWSAVFLLVTVKDLLPAQPIAAGLFCWVFYLLWLLNPRRVKAAV